MRPYMETYQVKGGGVGSVKLKQSVLLGRLGTDDVPREERLWVSCQRLDRWSKCHEGGG
jgi:hypothetical protein